MIAVAKISTSHAAAADAEAHRLGFRDMADLDQQFQDALAAYATLLRLAKTREHFALMAQLLIDADQHLADRKEAQRRLGRVF